MYDRHPYRTTHLITKVANLTGTRKLMLRAAFRAGLANKNTGENIAKGVEWSGLGAMLMAGGVMGERIVSEGGIGHPLLLAAGFAFATIGAITFNVSTFGRMTREQAAYSNKLINENPLLAMSDCLGQRQIWDELDANLLGRGIESMASYIKRNADDMLNRPSRQPAQDIQDKLATDRSEAMQTRLATLAEDAEVSALQRDHELRQSLIDTQAKLDRCINFAYHEGMLRKGEKTARMVEALAKPAHDNLVALELTPKTPKLPANGNKHLLSLVKNEPT